MTTAAARPRAAVTVVVLLLAAVVAQVQAAHAACHIAGFVDGAVEVDAGAGSVALTVELQGGQPACEGTVDWTTQDGSATAGTDYEEGSGTLTFEAGDDRSEDVTITILSGASAGDFQVVLDNPTGSITGTGDPATVTITGGGTATEAPPTDDATTPTDDATTPAEVPTEEPAEEAGSDLPWIPMLVVIIILGLLVAWYIARRTPEHPPE